MSNTLKWITNSGNYYYFGEEPTHATGVTLNKNSITFTEQGQSDKLIATVAPDEAVDKGVVWTSSDTTVAMVAVDGTVTCVNPGECTITCTTTDGGFTATCSIERVHASSVTLNKSGIVFTTAGQTEQLIATVLPADAYNKNVTWSSSNTSIATVDDNGLVTCVTHGTATITVTTVDGGFTATCNISVINFATQGPAPDGFHVPLISEWEGVKTIMDGLSLTAGDNWRINLHMPFAGFREYSDAGLNFQGIGYYWSSSPSESNRPDYARFLYLESYNIYTFDDNQRSRGFSIRCFKNSYMKPTSSWTVINGTLGSAGIFWNQSEGLISITSDGTTGYTIQDKNLGATTVYNDGDTLTQANMGNMYQWGNNYGFPSTGSVSKTSSTQVNAQNYGPGNYYESDTFITRSGKPYDWSSVRNDNLRGGVDGNVPV